MELSWPHICFSKNQIPKEAYSHIDDQVLNTLGGKFTEMFPLFGEAFREASLVIENEWSPPKLVLKKGLREWLSCVAVQTAANNLFFPLQPEFIDKEGELFDEVHQMLPESWKEIYRWFNSFHVTNNASILMDWWNTPFRYEARLDLDDYEAGSGASRKQTNQLAKAMGCNRDSLRCWLLTENEDALFINEHKCDRKVYHVHSTNLDEVTEILNPRESLDAYLAYYLGGGEPAGFNFALSV